MPGSIQKVEQAFQTVPAQAKAYGYQILPFVGELARQLAFFSENRKPKTENGPTPAW
jgi:hypothetical protein